MATSSDLVRWFRLDMDDLEVPYLWADEEIIEYANDAQQQFCRKTEGIADSRTPEICQLSVIAGTEWYPLDPRVLKLRRVTRTDRGDVIPVINPEQLQLYDVRFGQGAASPLKCFVAGLSEGVLRAHPVPSEATVPCVMEVFRLPLDEITDGDQALEIDSQHHRYLVLWMRHRGYEKQDADTYDVKAAELYEQKFEAYCHKALQEQERRRHVIGTVQYGGIW